VKENYIEMENSIINGAAHVEIQHVTREEEEVGR